MQHFLADLTPATAALLIGALLLAFGFEAINGFHDTANAVATVIYTNTLKPWYAVVWSGIWNFTGVVVSNSGPSIANGAALTDALALNPAIVSDSWAATGSGGTSGFTASGSGSISDSLTIPPGGSATYTVVAAIRSSATGTLANTATASASDAGRWAR